MSGRNNIKLRFIETASSQLNNNYKASNAFNCYHTGRRGTGGEWVSNNKTRNFWIKVKCPVLSLRGRETNTQIIYRWQLEASTDGENFMTLFSAPNPTYLGNEVQQFEVDTVHKYNCYRLLNPRILGCLTCNYSSIQTSWVLLTVILN